MAMLLVVALVAAAAVIGWLIGRRARPAAVADRHAGPQPAAEPQRPPETTAIGASEPSADLLSLIMALPGLVVLLGPSGEVRYASPPANQLGLARRQRLAFDEVSDVAREARERGGEVVRELSLRRPPLRKGIVDLRVRAVPGIQACTLLLIEDTTEENLVATVRRDFIANASHELKTPVGAISLLSEALMSATEDHAAVEHFALRLHTESARLSSLINDVIDLSRLQEAMPLAEAQPVPIDAVVAAAVDYIQAAAEAKEIEIVVGGSPGLVVMGLQEQLETALRNLLANAVSYSPSNTRVAVGVRRSADAAEIAVKDQGIGIDDEEQVRIFERFYRVDAARTRVTGGTGLGLAIVRNVCRNHGGDVAVWSVRDEGSTFTMRLPLHSPDFQPPEQSAPAEPQRPAHARPTEGSHQ